ncbi:hypothetical protein ACS2F9_22955, partial [Bacillus cereus group sp. BceL180]
QRAINPDTAAKSAYIMYDIKNAEKINKKEMSPDQLGVEEVQFTEVQSSKYLMVRSDKELDFKGYKFPVLAEF